MLVEPHFGHGSDVSLHPPPETVSNCSSVNCMPSAWDSSKSSLLFLQALALAIYSSVKPLSNSSFVVENPLSTFIILKRCHRSAAK